MHSATWLSVDLAFRVASVERDKQAVIGPADGVLRAVAFA